MAPKCAGVAAVLVACGTATATTITNNPVADFSALETQVGSTLVPIDLTAQPITSVSGLNAQNNVLVSNFAVMIASTTVYTGTLTSEVLANTGTAGPGVTDVVIKYTFEGNGPQGIDAFTMGVNTGTSLDYTDLSGATQGVITNVTTGGQVAPLVNLVASPDVLLDFDFNTAGDTLGAPSTTEDLVWYVHAPTGAVQVNVIDVVVTDSGSADIKALGFTTDFPGQHDLDVPAPGATALLGLAGVVGIRRRRR